MLTIYLEIEEGNLSASKLSEFESILNLTEEINLTPTPKSRHRISELLPKEITRVDVRFKKIYRGIVDVLMKTYEKKFKGVRREKIPELLLTELSKYRG